MNYFKNLLTGVSQFGGAICGVNCDCSISATTGYYNFMIKPTRYWRFMLWMIDGTFYAIEGSGHCMRAYEKDPEEKYTEGFKGLLLPFTLFFCLVLSIPFYLIFFFKKVKNN